MMLSAMNQINDLVMSCRLKNPWSPDFDPIPIQDKWTPLDLGRPAWELAKPQTTTEQPPPVSGQAPIEEFATPPEGELLTHRERMLRTGRRKRPHNYRPIVLYVSD